MNKFLYFEIDGYFKDNVNETFEGYIVKDSDEMLESEDDKIFYYGLSENQIKQAIEDGINTDLEFVITSYNPLTEI